MHVLLILSLLGQIPAYYVSANMAAEIQKPQADIIMQAPTSHVQEYNGNVLMKECKFVCWSVFSYV